MHEWSPLPATRTTDWACRERAVVQGERRQKSCGRTRHLHHGIAGKIRFGACTIPLYCLFVGRCLATQRHPFRQERERERVCVCLCDMDINSGHGRIITSLSRRHRHLALSACFLLQVHVHNFSTLCRSCGAGLSFAVARLASPLSATPIRAMQLANRSCSTRRVGRANTTNEPSHVMLQYSTSS